MFNKGGNIRKVYYTKISREKFLEMEYSEIPEDKKHFNRYFRNIHCFGFNQSVFGTGRHCPGWHQRSFNCD